MPKHPESYWRLDGTEPSTNPENDEARVRVGVSQYTKGWILLGRREGVNGYSAEIENSFSMGVSEDRARLYRRRADGYEDMGVAEEKKAHTATSHWPEPMRLWDVDDPECPVYLDWVWFEKNHERPGTIYGVDKFEVRNLKMIPKDRD